MPLILSYVIDGANDTASTLGDFHYKSKGAYDYLYDGNGSLKIDNNKGIDSIGYNYLSLPQYVHIKGKGTITYAYDTKGMKEAKVVVDSTQLPVKTTTTEYIKSYQYTNDTLAQCSIEEGRERYQKKYLLSGDSIYANFCDYFLKDHLGDTRVILTTEKDTTQYIATMEALYRTKENALFYNIDSTSYPSNLVPGGYPTDNTTVPNDSVALVSGTPGDHTQGPAIILKVMTGDSISVGVKSYYVGGGTAGNNSSSLPSVLNTLAGGLVALGGGGGHGTLATLDNTSGSPVYSALNSFLPSYDSTPSGKPKAYLNWMLLDNQFNYVSGNGQSGAIPVGAAGVLNALATTIKLKHSGYLYIWVSNETQNWNVFFDNLSIEDFSGPMLEETHYYPFGLTMAGISDKALKTPYAENKYRFNKGSELQNKEFSDGSGLELYETPLRSLDPQLGRWWQIDPAFTNGVDGNDEVNDVIIDGLKSQSPYASMDNNPIRLDDPKGDCPPCVAQVPVEAVAEEVEEVAPEVGHAVAAGATAVGVWATSNKDVLRAGQDPFEGAATAWAQVYLESKAVVLTLPADTKKPVTLTLPTDTKKPIAQSGSIYKVPGSATKSGKPYIGRHNQPNPAKTRKSNDGRDRTKAKVIDKYDPKNVEEGRQKEQKAIDNNGGVGNLDNKRNEIKKDPAKTNNDNGPQ